MLRVLGADLSRAGRKPHPAGASLELLPAAELPADLSWAAGSGHLATALARVHATVERGGRRSTGDPVRALVLDELSRWHGEPPGLSRAWVEERLVGLPDGDRPVARLALLVAFASYQVDAGVMLDCRAAGADDAALIEIGAWSALAAAGRMSRRTGRDVPDR